MCGRKRKFYCEHYTLAHISEVRNICGDNKEENIRKHLEIIKKVSSSFYLDFNSSIQEFTVRPRDPFEVFDTMNEVPQSYIDELNKHCSLQLQSNPDYPSDCYRPEDQFAFFAKQFRRAAPDLGVVLNNLDKSQAIEYIEQNVFNGISMDKSYEHIRNVFTNTPGAELFSKDFFIDITLSLAGYRTPNKEFKSASGIMLDHHHIGLLKNCQIIISQDKNFRKKVSDYGNSKRVFDLNEGAVFLLQLLYMQFVPSSK